MAEKTEQATPKKLRDARKKGQVAKSQDMPSSLTFVTSLMMVMGMSTFLFESVGGFLMHCFRTVGEPGELRSKIPGIAYQGVITILESSWPVMLIVSVVGVIVNFLIVGPVFSAEAMKFDLKKLNPIEGIKQKFKVKTLIELLKSIAKITGAAIIISLIIWNMLGQIITSAAIPVIGTVAIVGEFIMKATIQVGIFFLLVALFDLFFQKKNFAKEMKMEKFEVKQEYRDTEGDPQIKGKRRELSREIAYQEGPSAARGARVIVTNPTHIAVALKYHAKDHPTPTILTMGVGAMAEQIMKVGAANNVPIMRNVDLARKLYSSGVISQHIPEDTYEAVAEILKWIEALQENPDIDTELFR